MDIGALAGNTSKYDIPVSHLDYGYIENCTDTKYLEKILKVLRSGTEGKYQDLENFAERKLESLNPKSKALRKDLPIQNLTDLPKSEQQEIMEDIDSWTTEMKSGQQGDQSHVTNGDIRNIATNGTSYPVRGTTVIKSSQDTSASKSAERKTPKRVTPRDYREWDKINVDAELEKLDDKKQEKPQSGKSSVVTSGGNASGLSRRINTDGMEETEKQERAEREKEKGNEAFRAGDYTEAEVYYTRSLSLIPSVAARNNRAQTYIKLEQWDKAISDTSEVIKTDSNNIKAYLRRGVAYKGKSLFIEAKKDLDKVLSIEPTNKRASEVMKDVEKALGEQKTKGRRMIIEESDGSDEEEEEAEVVETKHSNGTSNTSEPVTTSTKTETPVTGENESKSNTDSSSQNGTAETVSSQVSDTKEESPNVQQSQSKQAENEKETDKKSDTGENVQQPEQPVAVEPAPPLPQAVVKLKDEGIQKFKAGRYAEALELYNKAIAVIEKDIRHRANLGVLYSNRAACKMKTGSLKACIEDCDKALSISPNSIKPLLRRANAYEGIEKYRLAYVDYRLALFLDPSSEVVKQGMTRCQSALQATDGPKWREKLPQMSLPTLPIPPITQAKTGPKNNSKQTESKVKDDAVDKAATFDEQKTKGNDFVKKGDFQSAIACYTKCTELCPENSVGFTNRALCYLRTNQPELALADCKEANRLEPDNVKALFRQGQAYKMLQDYDTSESRLRRVIALEPHNAAAKRELQVVLKYKEEEKAKKKAAPRKKIVIEESSSEESEDESPVQSDIKPESTKPASVQTPQNVPAQAKDNPKITTPADISAQTTDSKASKSTIAEKCDVNDERYKQTWDELLESSKSKKSSKKSETQTQEVTADTKDSGKTGSGKQEVAEGAAKSSGKIGSDVKYDLKVPKASSKIRPTAQSVPKLSKASGFEFMSCWSALKSPHDITPYMELLVQVTPNCLPSVISNKLEGEMLPLIGKCAGRLLEEGKASDGFDYLKYLTKVPRFQMNTMFMSESDKNELRAVFSKFKSVTDEKFTPADVDELRKKYEL